MKMELIKAEFSIVTPMFLGEADGQCASQIRPPTIKGALRFWWRALNWARVRQAHDCDSRALVELHQQEAALFGSSAKTGPDSKTQTGGQGRFLLRVSEQNIRKIDKKTNCLTSAPLQYLAGMGIYHFKKGLLRDYLDSGGTFTLQLALKPDTSEQQKQQLLDVLTCFGLLGCLGSRARKGFGSVSITALSVSKDGQEESRALPQNAAEYKAKLKSLLDDCFKANLPDAPLTAVTANTRMQIADSGRDALSLLADHGYEMGMYRGYGNNGKTFKKPAERNFQDDHDWAYAVAQAKKNSKKNTLPKRAVFGLPHPYFLSGIKKNVDIDVDLSATSARRASPLFAHIHALPDGNCLLIQSLFKELFLPDDTRVKVNAKGGDRFGLSGLTVTSEVDWEIIETFMDRFKDKDIIHG